MTATLTKENTLFAEGHVGTYTGKRVNLQEPLIETIDIRDIAKGLANNSRWVGQTQLPFTIAQHSVLAAWMAPAHLKPIALLHDAPEAYTGDVSRVLKDLIRNKSEVLHEIEHNLLHTICMKWNVDPGWYAHIKEFDIRLGEIEFAYFFERNHKPLMNLIAEHSGSGFPEVWNHQQAEIMFLMEFEKLFTAKS